MSLPPFNVDGDLPEGVHRANMPEVLHRFGQISRQRVVVAKRLERIYQLAVSTGAVARFVNFSSFVTAKLQPNDIDVFLLMDDSFELARVAGDAIAVSSHLDAKARFGASVFWARDPAHRRRASLDSNVADAPRRRTARDRRDRA